jgi:exopolysaccharide production protein ExoQ
MNATSLALPVARPLDNAKVFALPLRGVVLATALVLGAAFFLSEHDLHISLHDAYTQTAEQMEVTAGGGNAVRRLAFLVIGGWGMLLLVTGQQRLKVDPLLAGSLALLLAWAGVSFLWADDPGMCLRRLFVLGCCSLAAGGIARQLSIRELSWLTIYTIGTLAIVGVLAEIALGTFRPWAADYRFSGSLHPNTQGPGLAAVCLAALGLIRGGSRGRFALAAICAVAFTLLVLTKSRTATAAGLAGIGAVLAVQIPLRTKLAASLGLGWLALAGLWLVWVAGVDPLTDFRQAMLLGRGDESETLTGRAFIWPEVLYFIGQQPWLGHGYESFWTPARIDIISTNLGWGLREAHNAYLETLLWLGIIGLMLMLAVVAAGLVAAVRGYRDQRDPTFALPLGMLVFGLINAGLESGMVVIELVTFLLACCLLRMALFRDYSPESAT